MVVEKPKVIACEPVAIESPVEVAEICSEEPNVPAADVVETPVAQEPEKTEPEVIDGITEELAKLTVDQTKPAEEAETEMETAPACETPACETTECCETAACCETATEPTEETPVEEVAVEEKNRIGRRNTRTDGPKCKI